MKQIVTFWNFVNVPKISFGWKVVWSTYAAAYRKYSLKMIHSVVAAMHFSHWWMWVWVTKSSHIQQLSWFKWKATCAGLCDLVWLENLDGSCISHGTPALQFIKLSGNMGRNTVWSMQDTGLCILSAVRKVSFFWMTVMLLTLILRRSRMGTVWFYTSTSNKRAARPKLYTKSLTRDLKLMYSRLTLVRISINL